MDDNEIIKKAIDEALGRNESFAGSKLNDEAVKKLNRIANLCSAYKKLSPHSKYFAPLAVYNERNSFVTLIQPLPVFLESKKAKKILATLIYNADQVMIANSDKGLSMSFCVKDVWEV